MKKSLTDLALFGGKPAFVEKLHVGRPNIGDRRRLHERLDDMLDRRWLTNEGPFALDLEARLAALAGTRHAIAFCNATVALELMVRAANLTGEVIVPSFTFVATVHCLHAAGLTPVFCDVDPATHGLDPKKVEEDRSFWQFINIVAPILLVIAGGYIYQFRRKRKYQTN